MPRVQHERCIKPGDQGEDREVAKAAKVGSKKCEAVYGIHI